MLRWRKSVTAVLKSYSLNPDVAQATLARCKRLFASAELDLGTGEICRRHSQMNDIALVFYPESTIGRTTDFLHDRSAACARWVTVERRRLVGRRQLLEWHIAEFAVLLDRFQRLSVDEDQSSAAEHRPHVGSFRAEPRPITGYVGQRKGIICVGKHRAGQVVLPEVQLTVRAIRQRARAGLPAVAKHL